jgi:hypothetical protein
MYACFLLTARGWTFHEIYDSPAAASDFAAMAEDMMTKCMLGLDVLGYDVHELTNLSRFGPIECPPVAPHNPT